MPRRKRTFIERSRAHTYHVIRQPTGDNSENHVLVSDDKVFNNSTTLEDDGEFSSSYKPRDYELGEFGFPDDGYDYSKHFRHIGGGGGVFMSAATGLPDPDAVRNPGGSAKKTDATVAVKPKDAVIVKDSAADMIGVKNEEEEEEEETGIILDAQASLMNQHALHELERDRKRDADLNQVLHELEADDILSEAGEIGNDTVDEEVEQTEDDVMSSGEDNVDNYFGTLLNDEDDDEVNTLETFGHKELGLSGTPFSRPSKEEEEEQGALHGIKEKHREPRLLDAQFESFMRSFDDDASSSDEDEELDQLRQYANRESNEEDQFFALMTESEKQGLCGDISVEVESDNANKTDQFDADSLLQNLNELKLWDDSANGSNVNETKLASPSQQPNASSEHNEFEEANERTGESDDDTSRMREEVEGHRQAEFERGMSSVLASYQRVPVNEVLCGEEGEGVEGALKAMERQDQEEIERLKRLDDLGIDAGDSDGHDSELDTLFDEQFNNKAEDQWDCQTIISTYSNLENHPSVIDAPCRTRPPRSTTTHTQSIIQLDPRIQAPVQFISHTDSSSSRQPIDFGSRRGEPVMFNHGSRHKGESKQDKKARKAAVKEAARERRALKSEMKKAFNAEGVKQGKHSAALGNSKVAIRF